MSDFDDPFMEEAVDEQAAPSAAPESGASPKNAGERRLGIIGFPNSGKTSWLYALLNGPTPHVKGQRRWGRRDHDPAFAALTDGESGVTQQATAADRFSESRFCRMVRPWFGWPMDLEVLGTSQWVVIPEVGGEAVRRIALGRLGSTASASGVDAAARRYMEFLGNSDAILCFVAVDADDLSEDIIHIRQVLPKVTGRGDVLPVTVLLTKIDLIKRNESRDRVILPREHSAVGRISQRSERADLREFLDRAGSDESSIRFSVNGLLGSSIARGDLDLHEAIAIDFLKHDNPIAAQRLESLASTLGIDLRFFLSAPYGRDFENSEGTQVFPPVDQLRPVMVYEPLEDLLERSWRRRSRLRLRRRLLVAASIAVAFTLLGPGMAWWRERAFDQSMRLHQPPEEIRANLEAIESWWWNAIELSRLEEARFAQAERWLAYRGRLRELGRDPVVDPEFDEVEERAREFNNDPDIAVAVGDGAWRRLLDIQSERDSDRLMRFIESGGDLPGEQSSWDLSANDSIVLAARVDQLASQERDEAASRKLLERVRDVRSSLSGEGGRIPIVIEGEVDLLVRSLAKLEAVARLGSGSNGRLSDAENLDRLEQGLQADRPGLAIAASEEMFDTIVESLDARLEDPLQPGFELVASEAVRPSWLTSARDRELRVRFEQWWESLPARVVESLRPEAADQTRQAALVDAVEDADRIRRQVQAMDDSGYMWLEDSRSQLDDFAAIRARQEVLLRIVDASSFDKDAIDQVRRLFGGDRDWSASSPMIPALADEQEAVLSRTLKQMIAAAWDTPSRLDELSVMMDCLAIVERGEAGGVGERETLLLLRTIREDKRADPKFLEVMLRNLLERDPDLREWGELLADVLVDAPQFEQTSMALLPVLERVPVRSRVRFLERVLKGVDPLRWQELSSEGLLAWIEAMAVCGEPRVETARYVLAGLLSLVEESRSDAQRRDAIRTLAEVLVDQESKEPGTDLVESLLEDRDLARERSVWLTAADVTALEAGLDADPLTILRRSLLEAGIRSSWLRSGEDARREHLELIRTWGLVPVGRGDERFWMAPREWTQGDIQRIVRDAPDAWDDFWMGLQARGGLKEFNYSRTGRQEPGVGGVLPVGSFILKSSKDAADLVALAGLRLPSVAEWDRAAFPVLTAKFSSDPPLNASWQQLEAMGDITADGVVGLRWGVREWVADSEKLRGYSNVNPTSERAEAAQRRSGSVQYDEGIRPVLDGTPSILAEQ